LRKISRTAAKYADHAENKISKLQQAYLKKYYPQYAHSTEDSQHPQDVQNKRFGGKVSALFRGRREDLREPEPAKPSLKKVSRISPMGSNFTEWPSALVSDDDCREAVNRLNDLRFRGPRIWGMDMM
jgi:hypothetical protein